ncbi:MAG TPA: NUDIX domain-containing protein [Nitrososphaeraceae archaeon]|nr:NUDIX domain-containing protein [Nitrososphaeraceae archaeon]
MRDERSSGAVVFSIDKDSEAEFLLLHHTSGHWDFPKGNIESGEDEKQAARREILEETGIQDVNFLEGFREKIEYRYKRGEKLIHKEVIFYLLRTNTKKITLSNEHIAYVWNKYDNAVKQLTYKNTKNVLTEAKKFLETNSPEKY